MSYATIVMDTEPMINPQPKTAQNTLTPEMQLLIERAIADATIEAKAQVKALMSKVEESEKRINESAERIQGLAKANKAILHVKVNDKAPVNLKNKAHPKLGEIIAKLKMARESMKWPLQVGPSGCGKSYVASQVAEAMGLMLREVSCNGDMSKAALCGMETATGYKESGFIQVIKNGGVFFIDEIFAAPSDILVLLNGALASLVFENPTTGERIPFHKDAYILAGDNTHGRGADHQFTSRNRVDASLLSRFISVSVNYDTDFESSIMPDTQVLEQLWSVRNRLQEINSDEILGTREIKYVATALTNGFELADIFADLSAGWPKGLAAQVGLIAPVKTQAVSVVDDGVKRGPGRPPGSKNKPKADITIDPVTGNPVNAPVF